MRGHSRATTEIKDFFPENSESKTSCLIRQASQPAKGAGTLQHLSPSLEAATAALSLSCPGVMQRDQM